MPKEHKKFEYVDDVLEDLHETTVDLFNAVEELTNHLQTVAENIAKLHPIEAIEHAADGTNAAIDKTAEAAGNVGQVAVDTLEAPIKLAAEAAETVSDKSKQFNNKLHKLKMR